MISGGINAALNGLTNATANQYQASKEIAQGNIDVEPIVNSVIAARDVQTQIANLNSQLETQEYVLDLFA